MPISDTGEILCQCAISGNKGRSDIFAAIAHNFASPIHFRQDCCRGRSIATDAHAHGLRRALHHLVACFKKAIHIGHSWNQRFRTNGLRTRHSHHEWEDTAKPHPRVIHLRPLFFQQGERESNKYSRVSLLRSAGNDHGEGNPSPLEETREFL
jgi:hypothetical protein